MSERTPKYRPDPQGRVLADRLLVPDPKSLAPLHVGEAKQTPDVEIEEKPEAADPRGRREVFLTFHHLDAYQAEAIKAIALELPRLADEVRAGEFRTRVAALLQALAPADPLAAARLKLLREDALAREDFFARIPVLDSTAIAERAGYSTRNKAQTAWRWREAGKIFSVAHRGVDCYPAFQFDANGQPLPVMSELLAILGRDAKRTDWQNAFWFISGNGWLGGDAPIDRLTGGEEDTQAVKAAAERAVEPEIY